MYNGVPLQDRTYPSDTGRMTTERKQDYYDVLGLPRNASPDDIKKAFRRLAMRYHPDRNQDGGAEARFKEVNEAYEVLSDPDRRAMYDRFGHAAAQGGDNPFARNFEGFGFGGLGDIFDAFFGGAGSRTQRGPARGADVRKSISINFTEAVFGVTTFARTIMSPRPPPRRCGTPLPRITNNSPPCVPAGIRISCGSSSTVGTETSSPSAACA